MSTAGPPTSGLSLVAQLRQRWRPGDPALICPVAPIVHRRPDARDAGAWESRKREREEILRPADEVKEPEVPELDYAALDAIVENGAGLVVALGLGVGDVLALQAPRSAAWLGLVLGAWSRGVAVLLLNPSYTADELAFFLADAGAVAAVLPPAVRDALGEAAPPGPDGDALTQVLSDAEPAGADPSVDGNTLALIAYTSGTTGRPKGARLRHSDVLGTVEALHGAWGWRPDDVLVHTLPLFHIHGLFVAALGALWAGARIVLMPDFDAMAAIQAVEDHRATVLMGVPTHHHRYLALPEDTLPDVSSLRLMTSGSAPLPAARHVALSQRFGVDVVERYGMTEVGIVLSNPLDGERRPGTVGMPLPGVLSRVVGEDGQDVAPGVTGELHISSPGLFEGYHGLPEATAQAVYEDGGRRWMRTGDLCRVDSDGYHHIVGRASDMVITGGLNVYPREVERVLLDVAGGAIDNVSVVGIPDEEWGERLVALVVLVRGAEADLEGWLAACRARLAAYKCPRELRLAKTLPCNAMGKVQKHQIRAEWVLSEARRVLDPDLAWLELTMNPGIEDLAASELQRLLAARGLPKATIEVAPRGAKGRVLVSWQGPPASLLACAQEMRSIHHVLRPLGRLRIPDHGGLAAIRAWFGTLAIPELDAMDDGALPSFRVTCERSGKHPFTSEQVAREAGAGVRSRALNPVDLTGFDVHVRADVRRTHCNAGVQLTARSLSQRLDRPFRPRIKLRANIAWAMLEMSRSAEMGPSKVILDPFCGSGTLLLEAGRRWPDAQLLGSDAHDACAEGTAENAEQLGISGLISRVGDARDVDVLWADHRPDTVVANLPFGLRLSRGTNHYWLYRNFLEGLARIMDPGGRVVLLVGKRKVLNRVVAPNPCFDIVHVRIVEMGGAWPALFVLERQDVPAPPRDEPNADPGDPSANLPQTTARG